jgi:hypothetical protein
LTFIDFPGNIFKYASIVGQICPQFERFERIIEQKQVWFDDFAQKKKAYNFYS